MKYRIMHLEGTYIWRIEKFMPARWYRHGYWRVCKTHEDTGEWAMEFASHIGAVVAMEQMERRDNVHELRANGRWIQVQS